MQRVTNDKCAMSRIISLVARVTVNEAVSIHPHHFSYPFLLETPCQSPTENASKNQRFTPLLFSRTSNHGW